MKVLNEYPGSHHYVREYKKSQYFCPICGNKEVWEEMGQGDYYQGSDYVCISCGCKSYLDGCSDGPNEVRYMNILEQLRTGITMEPTTRKGK